MALPFLKNEEIVFFIIYNSRLYINTKTITPNNQLIFNINRVSYSDIKFRYSSNILGNICPNFKEYLIIKINITCYLVIQNNRLINNKYFHQFSKFIIPSINLTSIFIISS